MTVSDSDLVSRVLKGHIQSMDILVKRYSNRIYNLAYRIIGDSEEARDITQETFLKAYKSLHQFKIGTNFNAWICRIATNNCLQYLKKAGKKQIVDIQMDEPKNMIDILGSQDSSPAELLENKELNLYIRKCISGLPKKYRIIILLFYMNDLSCREIGKILGIPEFTVRNRLCRARRQLRDSLESVYGKIS
jgi:RNA polymerase sigma-70 factor (ECF subfamily)